MSDEHIYYAVWREGTGAQFWRVGLGFDALVIEDATFLSQGLRMSLLRRNSERLLAVWRAGSGQVFWHTGLDADEFKHKDKKFFDDGLRLVSMDIDGDRFSGVWRPGSGAQRWESGLTLDQLKAKDLHFFNEGLRMVTLARSSQAWYSLWRAGGGHQHWLATGGTDAIKRFERENQKQFDAGQRLVALTGEGLNAVWRAGTDAQADRTLIKFHDLKKTDEEYFNLGMRLVELNEGLFVA
jgi:hypothetical protein